MLNDTAVLINDGKLSEIQLEKIFALKALKSNPGLLGNVFSFEKLVYVLNGVKPNVDIFDPPTILHIAKALHILGIKEEWHTEIKKYIAHLAKEEGWVYLPKVLDFAQPELDEISHSVELDEEQKAIQKLKHQAIEKYLVINV
jgi:hypothetical protein